MDSPGFWGSCFEGEGRRVQALGFRVKVLGFKISGYSDHKNLENLSANGSKNIALCAHLYLLWLFPKPLVVLASFVV